jgi:fibronectin type III domain protein
MCRKRLIVAGTIAVLLRAATATAEALTLAWDPPADASIVGYIVSYGTQTRVYTSQINAGNTTRVTIPGLAAGVKYFFAVQSYNAYGVRSAMSAEVNGVAVGFTTLLSTASTPSAIGTPITWTALTSATLTVEYKFLLYSQSSGTWAVVQDYSSSNKFSWTPGGGDAGSYTMQVWVRTPGFAGDFQTWASSGLVVGNGPVKIGSIEPAVALPAAPGTAITWTAKALGGPAPLQYRFLRYNRTTGAWTIARDYSTSNTFTWTPAPNEEGSYLVQVWVRGAGSTAAFDAWRNSETFEIQSGPVGVASLNANATFPVATGTTVKWTAVAGGGPVEYKFVRLAVASKTWSIVQDYSPSNSYTWTPTTTGTYNLQVWARRIGSTAAFEAWAGTGNFQVANSMPVATLSADIGSPFGTGSTQTWRVAASGGPGPLQYKFWLYNVAKDSWSVARDYGTDPTFSWTAAVGSAGTYNLQAWVRRSGSTAAYDAWVGSPAFTVSDTLPVLQRIVSTVSGSVGVGTPVILTAIASGGPGPLEYRFLRYNLITHAWAIVHEYSWDNTLRWCPNPARRVTTSFRSGSVETAARPLLKAF